VNPQFAMRIAFLVVLFAMVLALGAQKSASQQASSKSKASVSQARTNESAEGEKRFETNCGRCHVPPEDLSPRKARAVIRQMRVRANLSAEDERLILKYLAP
jgi:cytochrome c5